MFGNLNEIIYTMPSAIKLHIVLNKTKKKKGNR